MGGSDGMTGKYGFPNMHMHIYVELSGSLAAQQLLEHVQRFGFVANQQAPPVAASVTSSISECSSGQLPLSATTAQPTVETYMMLFGFDIIVATIEDRQSHQEETVTSVDNIVNVAGGACGAGQGVEASPGKVK